MKKLFLTATLLTTSIALLSGCQKNPETDTTSKEASVENVDEKASSVSENSELKGEIEILTNANETTFNAVNSIFEKFMEENPCLLYTSFRSRQCAHIFWRTPDHQDNGILLKKQLFPLLPPDHTPAPSAFCAPLPLFCHDIPEGKAHSPWQSAPVSSLQKSFLSRICTLCLSGSTRHFLSRHLRNHYISRKPVKFSHLQLNLCANLGILF